MTNVAIEERSARITTLLRDNAISDLRQLEVWEDDEEVVITGMVTSYYMKQMAQETVRPALCGRRLRNRVRVALAG